MEIDSDKLSALAKTLTDDQRRLLAEGLGGGDDLDPTTVAEALRAVDVGAVIERVSAAGPRLDAGPLTFRKARARTRGAPVVITVDQSSVTLADVARLAKEKSGRDVTSVSEVRVLDLDPSEVTDDTLARLASHDLTSRAASARRLTRVEYPAMTTSVADLGDVQEGETGPPATARRVVVVIVLGPIIIIIIFTPTDPLPPSEPPLTRW